MILVIKVFLCTNEYFSVFNKYFSVFNEYFSMLIINKIPSLTSSKVAIVFDNNKCPAQN